MGAAVKCPRKNCPNNAGTSGVCATHQRQRERNRVADERRRKAAPEAPGAGGYQAMQIAKRRSA